MIFKISIIRNDMMFCDVNAQSNKTDYYKSLNSISLNLIDANEEMRNK